MTRRCELTVSEIVPGGEGLCRVEGQPITLVPDVAAGDRIIADVAPASPTLRRGRLVEIVERGPGRREPPCPEAGRCGGCDWQHLTPAAQAGAIGGMLETALRRTGRLEPAAIDLRPPRLVTGDGARRQRARFAFEAATGRLGFRRRASREVWAMPTCPAVEPELDAIRGALADALPGLLHSAAEVQVDVPAPGAATVDLRLAEPASTMTALADAVLAAHPAIGAVRVGARRSRARASAGTDAVGYRRGPTEDPRRFAAWHAPGTFLQPSRAGSAALVSTVLELVRRASPDASPSVLELHAGSGNFSLPLAEEGAAVTAVERDGRAVALGRRAAEAAGLELTLTAEDARAALARLSAEHRSFDVAVLDPPRTGARDELTALAAIVRHAVVYASCDAVTFARDAALLSRQGFRLMACAPLGLFPDTSHFETVSLLARPDGALPCD